VAEAEVAVNRGAEGAANRGAEVVEEAVITGAKPRAEVANKEVRMVAE